VALGRSFGLVPANRGVVAAGPYRLVRHPIYLGYLVTHLAFVVANPLWWNVWMLGVADTALVVRLLYEERTLARDARYVNYRERVRWRLVPGVF
jgi:protein-S-isoprenylcysteine O-methyltransferase Ste14